MSLVCLVLLLNTLELMPQRLDLLVCRTLPRSLLGRTRTRLGSLNPLLGTCRLRTQGLDVVVFVVR